MQQHYETLILIPTQLERDHLRSTWPDDEWKTHSGLDGIKICGFGPIVAAAQSMRLLHDFRPRQVLLIGIAGTYRSELLIGEAYQFTEIACHGIGIGSDNDFKTAEQIGWRQWAGDPETETIGDKIQLMPAIAEAPRTKKLLLLTVTAAASKEADVQFRKTVFPEAVAEEMEGFGVATACQLMRVPLAIIRGISNQAGDRDFNNWQIESALQAAGQLAKKFGNRESVYD